MFVFVYRHNSLFTFVIQISDASILEFRFRYNGDQP